MKAKRTIQLSRELQHWKGGLRPSCGHSASLPTIGCNACIGEEMMRAIAQCGSLAILTLLLSASCLAQAGGYDRISIRAGGLMTPALDININLHTGEVVRRSQKLGGDTASREWSESRRTLSPTELTHLVGVIEANPAKNWESDECLQRDKLAEAARERGDCPYRECRTRTETPACICASKGSRITPPQTAVRRAPLMLS